MFLYYYLIVWGKIISSIISFIIIFISAVYGISFFKDKKFDLLLVQNSLSGAEYFFSGAEIIWEEASNGDILGNTSNDKNVKYILNSKSISSITTYDTVEEVKFPCLTFVDLLPTLYIKDIREMIKEMNFNNISNDYIDQSILINEDLLLSISYSRNDLTVQCVLSFK